jgi:hypothetical protein
MGFKREGRSTSGGKKNEAAKSYGNSNGKSSYSKGKSYGGGKKSYGGNSRGKGDYAFIRIGSIKSGRQMSEDVAAQLKNSEEYLNVKLYMPEVESIRLRSKAILGIKLGAREDDKDFVLGQVVLPMGSVTPTKNKTSDDVTEFLHEYATIEDFDLILDIYLPEGTKSVELTHEQLILLSFKTNAEQDFVLGQVSIPSESE